MERYGRAVLGIVDDKGRGSMLRRRLLVFAVASSFIAATMFSALPANARTSFRSRTAFGSSR
jgi:hypothetical protein